MEKKCWPNFGTQMNTGMYPIWLTRMNCADVCVFLGSVHPRVGVQHIECTEMEFHVMWPHVSAIGWRLASTRTNFEQMPNQRRSERRHARIRTEPKIKWMDAEAGNADSRDSGKMLRFHNFFAAPSSFFFFFALGFWRSIDRHRQRWRLTVTAFAHFWLIRQRHCARRQCRWTNYSTPNANSLLQREKRCVQMVDAFVNCLCWKCCRFFSIYMQQSWALTEHVKQIYQREKKIQSILFIRSFVRSGAEGRIGRQQ